MEEITELRQWSAELLGIDLCYYTPGGHMIHWPKRDGQCSCGKYRAEYWRPDVEHTGQIWLVDTRMQELTYKLGLTRIPNPKCDDEKLEATYDDWDTIGRASEPCLAILRAAKAAWEVENGLT